MGFEIGLARHALEGMALRGVSVGELGLALAGRPSYRDVSGAEVYIRKLNDRTLVVVAERVGDALKVVTVYKAKKVDKFIRSKVRFMEEVGMRKATSPLKVLYDPVTDILYFHFADGEVEEVLEAGDVVVELGKEGRIMGMEVWGASRRGVIEELRRVVATAQARGGEPVKRAR